MMLRPRPRVRYVVPLLIVATLIMWAAPAESGPAAQDDQPQPVETEIPEKPTLKYPELGSFLSPLVEKVELGGHSRKTAPPRRRCSTNYRWPWCFTSLTTATSWPNSYMENR